MIKKILRNIIYPHKIHKKIIKKINFYIAKKKYNENYFTEQQNKIFKNLDLNRLKGLKKLQDIKIDLNFENRESPMSSEHEVLFSSLSLNNNIKINQILEIGTFDGMNSLLLSKIFPNANIDTIDLPNTESDFKNYYNRKNMSKIVGLIVKLAESATVAKINPKIKEFRRGAIDMLYAKIRDTEKVK